MSTTFADAATIRDIPEELDEFQEYFVAAWLGELRIIDRNASNESVRSRNKLSKHITDRFDIDGHNPRYFRRGCDYMSQDLQNIVPYGMSRDCSWNPRRS